MQSAVLLSVPMLFIALGARDAAACQCVPSGPPCQKYFQSDVVFIGTVRSITWDAGADVLARVRVEFEDAVPSRGGQGRSITVFTSNGAGSCGYPFKQGGRYLVYANRMSNQIVITICSRTRPIADAGADLAFLKTLATPSEGAHVSGSVDHWNRNPATGDTRRTAPVANVLVTLRGTNRLFETRTSEAGRYRFDAIPAGRYELTALPPPPYSRAHLTRTFDLPDPRACFTADFALRYDSRISSAIADADGRPVSGATVEATLAEHVGKRVSVEPYMGRTDASGGFEFTEVSPDRYVLAVNVPRGPESDIVSPTSFHPGTFDPAHATVFEVGAGEHVRLDPMTLPRMPPSYRINGTASFEDGRPAVGALVALFDGDGRWKQVADAVQVDGNGGFSLPVHEGINYVVSAWFSDPGSQRTRAAGSVSFVGSEAIAQSLKVVLKVVRR
jgi:hypothetical protein